MSVLILDGPLGSELHARGVETHLPEWSAGALADAPDVVAAIHRDYAAAGAQIHTTNTFRTRSRQVGDRWEELARKAVQIARAAASGDRIAGSIAPLEDCYRPDLSPAAPRHEHRALCRVLADAGVDLLLCETFSHVGEARVAVEEAVATGLPTWAALTAGPDADLITPKEMGLCARDLVSAGASAVLVNCVPAALTLPYVLAIAEANVPFGAYANAGSADDKIGWHSADDGGPERYVELAATWALAGATLIGGCCGTGPRHIAALAGWFAGRRGDLA